MWSSYHSSNAFSLPSCWREQVLIEKPSTVNTEKLVYTQELELVYIEELVNHSQHK